MASGVASEKVRQHLVSRALLKRFREPGETESGLVGVLDVVTGRTLQAKSTKAIGFMPRYIKHRANYMESLWSEVEDLLPAAFAELDEKPEQLSPESARTVADCAALHFVRSHQSRRAHESAFAETVQRFRGDRMALVRLAKLKYGLELEYADSVLNDLAEDMLMDFRAVYESGELFQQRQEEHFEKARRHMSTMPLTVLHAADHAEFIVGDCPAAGIGPSAPTGVRAALFDASAILMPLGPKALAVFGPASPDAPAPVGPDVARVVNRAQIAQAFRQVYYRRISGQAWVERGYRPPIVGVGEGTPSGLR